MASLPSTVVTVANYISSCDLALSECLLGRHYERKLRLARLFCGDGAVEGGKRDYQDD